MPYNPKIHHRRSIRVKGYDYSSYQRISEYIIDNPENWKGDKFSDE